MKFTKLFIRLFVLAVFSGCSPREEKIDGSIFIVTQGGENFKLGLVTASIFDRQQIDSVLEKDSTDLQNKLTVLKTDLKRLNDEKEDLTQKRNAASGECDSREQNLDAAETQAEATAKKFDPLYFWGREKPPARAALTDDEKEQIDAARKTIAQYNDLQTQIDKLAREQQQLPPLKAVHSDANVYGDAPSLDDEEARQKVIDEFTEKSDALLNEQSSLNEESAKTDLANLETHEEEIADLQAMWDKYNPEFVKETNEVNQLESEWEKSKDVVDGFAEPLKENQAKMDSDAGQLQNWTTVQPQTYFTSLSTPLAISKTDADGKFSFQIPTKGEFVLAAQAQRQVADNVEKYFWLVRVHSDGKSEMQVMLSNDNLVTANSADSAVQFPMP